MVDQQSTDIKYMQLALELARQAGAQGEVPVGALLVDHKQNKIVAKGLNLREKMQSPLAHAELLALHRGSQKIGSWRLMDCTLYVTLEPCPMCAGALINSRIHRVVFGALDPKAGATHTLLQLGTDTRFNHRFEVTGGVLQDECAQLLREFFQKLRKKKSEKP